MRTKNYLTPRKFLICCGLDKRAWTETTLADYLGKDFLNIQIYNKGSTFDSYCISRTEDLSSRYFMDPSGKSRRSLSLEKSQDLCDGLTEEILQSVVDTIEIRIANPVFQHPEFDSIIDSMRKHGWEIDQEAEADLVTASNRNESIRIMILIFAAIFQDYYSVTGVHRKIRAFLGTIGGNFKIDETTWLIREGGEPEIYPITALRTNGTYVRRGDLLAQIKEKLGKLQRLEEKRFLFLYGDPGTGKSELVRAYCCESVGSLYKKQFWLTCPIGEETISLSGLCKAKESSSGYGDLYKHLSEATSEILLIIDHFNMEIHSLINELYYYTGDATVLITTRLRDIVGFDEKNTLFVYSDKQEDFCLEIFRKNYEKKHFSRRRHLTDLNQELVKEICKRVYMNPLFISMIASFLREHADSITIEQFIIKLRNGLVEAFPVYSQLYFGKDKTEPVMIQPMEVLQVILEEELNSIRFFSEEERQVLNLLTLFPAYPIPSHLICQMLGDTMEHWKMKSIVERLYGIVLLRREEEAISIQPLLCELIRSDLLMNEENPILFREEERDSFFTHILENILLLSQDKLSGCMHLIHRIYKEIQNPMPELKLLFYTIFDRKVGKALLPSFLSEEKNPLVIARCDSDRGKKFVIKNMKTGELKTIMDLSGERYQWRYYGISGDAHVMKKETFGETALEQAHLIFFYEGAEVRKDPFFLDFSEGIDGYPLFNIPDSFMRLCRGSFRILFPKRLKRIGEWAFDCCHGLLGPLVFPDSLEEIGVGAFHGCSNLDIELHLPEKLKVLDSLAFCLCTKLRGPLKLPDHLEILGERAFCYCKGLEGRVDCPSNLKYVGEDVFAYCKALSPSEQFACFTDLEKIEKRTEKKDLFIPLFSEKIEHEAFCGQAGLRGELKIPASVVEIGDQAFYRCGKITGKLDLPASLKYIGAGAFYGCESLRGSIDLPDTVEEIGDGAFFGCSGLKGVIHLSKNLKSIPTAAFFRCKNLQAIDNLGELQKMVLIQEGAFWGCESLSGELHLPENLTEIGDGAFDFCIGLSELYFSKTDHLKKLGNGAFCNCRNLKGTLQLPAGIQSVGEACFWGCGYETCIIPNRDCELKADFVRGDVQIIGFKGSSAEEYAQNYGNRFQPLEE